MTMPPTWFKACAASLLLAANLAHAGDKVALITIQDGPASVIHATSRLSALEGASLEAEDIVETAATTPLLRIEFDDGTALDVGPSSRVLIWPKWPSGSDSAASGSSTAYVLEGWAKVTAGKSPGNGKSLLSTAAFDLSAMGRDAVVRVKGRDADVFAESDDVAVAVRGKGAKSSPVKLGRGQFMTRRGDAAPEFTMRPQPDFIQSVPRPFMDTLPARAALFKGKKVTLTPLGPLSYTDTQMWLNAEPRVRTRFTTRWKVLAQDATFRRELSAQLPLHPEWGPLLAQDKSNP